MWHLQGYRKLQSVRTELRILVCSWLVRGDALGELFLELGQTERALSEFQRCHQIVMELDQAGKLQNANANLATAVESIGVAWKRKGDLNEAKKNLLIALGASTQIL